MLLRTVLCEGAGALWVFALSSDPSAPAGYQTWMDVDKMSGSTLEAMAKAVEGSATVLVCVSKKYKESQVGAEPHIHNL